MAKLITYFALLMFLTNCFQQKNTNATQSTIMDDDFDLDPENGHPNAQKLLTEEFYWSPIEETGPFGSDDGSDAFYGFREWRQVNKNESPVSYLKQLIEQWGYEPIDWNIIEKEKIKEMIDESDSQTIIGQDNAIIAIGFGQFVLEGRIDRDIKALTKKAIQRELTTELISQFSPDYRKTREGQLTKMLDAVNKMNE